MSNRIDRCFSALAESGRTALIPFITAGDPEPDWTVDIMHALVQSGADLIAGGIGCWLHEDPYAGKQALPQPNGADAPAAEIDVPLYSVDSLVRRARALQLTVEARRAAEGDAS